MWYHLGSTILDFTISSRFQKKQKSIQKLFQNNNGMLKCTNTAMGQCSHLAHEHGARVRFLTLYSSTGNMSISWKSIIKTKNIFGPENSIFFKLRKPACKYAVAMATSKASNNKLSHQHVREGWINSYLKFEHRRVRDPEWMNEWIN